MGEQRADAFRRGEHAVQVAFNGGGGGPRRGEACDCHSRGERRRQGGEAGGCHVRGAVGVDEEDGDRGEGVAGYGGEGGGG